MLKYFSMKKDEFIIGIDADLLKPRNQSLWRRWKRLSSLQRSIILIGLLFITFISFQWLTSPQINDDFNTRIEMPIFVTKSSSAPDGRLVSVHLPPSDANTNTAKIIDGGLPHIPRPPRLSKGSFEARGPTNDRMQSVVDAFMHSWKGYKAYAWGHDELKPISKGYSTWFDLGLTIVDSLDTMYLMGLKEEFEEAKNWVAKNLTYNKGRNVNLFECTIRILAGLLSAYHLSGDDVFRKKAQQLGDKLLPAFDTQSGVPYSDLDFTTGKAHNPTWGADSSTSEVSTLQLEFIDLSRITKNPKYGRAAMKTFDHLHSLYKREGLVPIFINPSTGAFRQSATITLGARGDSYYEYLLKVWILTGNEGARDDYIEAMHGMEKLLMRETSASKLLYVGELLSGTSYSPKMDHLVCFLGGNLALAASRGLESSKFMDIGKRLTDTCIEFYERMATGLSPEIVHFNTQQNISKQHEIFVKSADSHNLQRPETIESLFYLYRLTGDKSYQDVGWKIFKAFEQYTKVEDGYTSIGNVMNPQNVQPRNKMESFWLSETLKYFYLLFSDDPNYVSLNEFLFNTEAHLIPMKLPGEVDTNFSLNGG